MPPAKRASPAKLRPRSGIGWMRYFEKEWQAHTTAWTQVRRSGKTVRAILVHVPRRPRTRPPTSVPVRVGTRVVDTPVVLGVGRAPGPEG